MLDFLELWSLYRAKHKADSLFFFKDAFGCMLALSLGFVILIVIKLNLLYLWTYVQTIKF